MENQTLTPRIAEGADLLKRVQRALAGLRFAALNHLKVEVSGDTVTIVGEVRTFYERQVGVECCKRVPGVRSVRDCIRVIN